MTDVKYVKWEIFQLWDCNSKGNMLYFMYLMIESIKNKPCFHLSTAGSCPLKLCWRALRSVSLFFCYELSSSRISGCSCQNCSPIMSQWYSCTLLLLRIRDTSFSSSFGSFTCLVTVSSCWTWRLRNIIRVRCWREDYICLSHTGNHNNSSIRRSSLSETQPHRLTVLTFTLKIKLYW